MFETLSSQIGAGIAALVVVFAFVKGDEPERLGAGAYGLSLLASLLVQDASTTDRTQWGLFAIDLIMLAVYGGLAWKSRRSWPVWASALQALIVTSHLLMVANLRPTIDAFYAAINLASYGIMVALAVGTFWAWQERRAASFGQVDIPKS